MCAFNWIAPELSDVGFKEAFLDFVTPDSPVFTFDSTRSTTAGVEVEESMDLSTWAVFSDFFDSFFFVALLVALVISDNSLGALATSVAAAFWPLRVRDIVVDIIWKCWMEFGRAFKLVACRWHAFSNRDLGNNDGPRLVNKLESASVREEVSLGTTCLERKISGGRPGG